VWFEKRSSPGAIDVREGRRFQLHAFASIDLPTFFEGGRNFVWDIMNSGRRKIKPVLSKGIAP
jgi:hypothetical protein